MSRVATALQPLRQANMSAIVGSIAAAGIGAAIYYRNMSTAHADSGAPNKLFTGMVMTSLPLASSETVNHNTKRLRFKLPENAISGYPLTSAVLTFSWPKGSWTPVVRPYTPISSPDEPGALELMVKQYPNGKASTHLHSLSPGDSLFFVTRLPGYAYKPNEFARVTLIAGGMGITPIYQLAAAILANPADTTRVEVVCGVNSDADVLLRDEFAEWERRFPGRFKASWVVSHPAEGSAHPQGYVTGELLRRTTAAPSPDSKVFVSGPPAMEEALVGSWKKKGVLEELGYTKQQVHKF